MQIIIFCKKNERSRQLGGLGVFQLLARPKGRYACRYCAARSDDTVLKRVLSCVPRPLTTAIIATEMPAAIRPYSIAVVPDSFFRNATNLDIGRFHHWVEHSKMGSYNL